MDADAFDRALRRFVQRRKFRPFTIELLSGDRFVVRHPEAIRSINDVYTFSDTDFTVRRFDASTVCQLISEVMPPH